MFDPPLFGIELDWEITTELYFRVISEK